MPLMLQVELSPSFHMQVYDPTDTLDRVLYVFACKKTKCQLSASAWRCIRQQKEVEEEEEEKPQPPKPSASSSLSWDFGGNSTSSLFGGSLSGNADIMNLLAKMEKKEMKEEAPKTAAKEVKIPRGIPVRDRNHPMFPEMFIDVAIRRPFHCRCSRSRRSRRRRSRPRRRSR